MQMNIKKILDQKSFIWVFLGRNLKKQQQQQQLLTYLESVPFGIRVSCKTKNLQIWGQKYLI